MRHAKLWLTFFALTLPLTGDASVGGEPLLEALEAVTEQPRFQHAHWGILVTDLETGEVLFERNADKLFVPASTTKLFSVAAALLELGADHRFETRVLRSGDVNADGTLAGDLVLLASGDLSLGGRTLPDGQIAFTDTDHIYANGGFSCRVTTPDPLAGLDELAQGVAAAGIRRIDGEVIVDDRLFEKDLGSGSGPSTLTPIMVNDNLIDVIIEPTTSGEAAKIDWRPRTAAAEVEGTVQTVSASENPRVMLIASSGNRLKIVGQVPEGHAPIVRVHEVEDPARFARTLFIEALQRAEVEVTANPTCENRLERLPPQQELLPWPTVAQLTSPPFAQSARLILKVSHNLHASTLPLLLATRHGQRTLRDGLERQRDLLASLGVEVDTISFGGGAGGSRADHLTPRATVALLRAMADHPEFEAYYEALPVLGIDGTLAQAVDAESPARGRVRAKTGTLYWHNTLNGNYLLTSKALAGYATTATERRLAFSLVVNHVHLERGAQTAEIGRVLGQLAEIIHDAL